jgi:hypothetical protein
MEQDTYEHDKCIDYLESSRPAHKFTKISACLMTML